MRLPFARNYFEICLSSIYKDFYQIWKALSTSVVDRHRFDADPYPNRFDADPDPNVHVDVDLDRDPDRQFLLLFTAMPVFHFS